MASIAELSQPKTEPVDLDTAKAFLRLPAAQGTDDDLIENVLIPGARRQLENAIGLVLASRDFVQYEDGFPWPDHPFYFSMPDPNVTQLLRNPVTAVEKIEYIGLDGVLHTLLPARDFVVDFTSQPGRITPLPIVGPFGNLWPFVISGMNSVRIYYTAGFDLPKAVDSNELKDIDLSASVPTPPNQFSEIKFDNALPADLRVAMLQLIVHWYQNRDVIVSTAGAGGQHVPLPWHMQQVIDSYRVWQF